MGDHRRDHHSGQPGKLARLRAGTILAVLAISAAACTTGSVLSLQPAVDVGPPTASIPRMETAVAATPIETVSPPADTLARPAGTLEAQAEALAIPPEAPVESPVEAPVRTASASPRQGVGLQTLVPSDPYMAGYPRPDPPQAPEYNPLPSDEVDCRRELKRMKVQFVDLAPIRDGQCGIDHPVKVSAIGNVQMKPAATLTCAMALTFSQWTKNELVPSARRRYFSGIKTIHQGSSYSCRKIARSRTLSEHGKGNALDIMRIELNNGKDIDVKKPGFFSFRQRGFLNNVRGDGCQYFNTVLGPGYNYDHRNHFHFDIKQRRNNRVACH
jgi:hypothetical protein